MAVGYVFPDIADFQRAAFSGRAYFQGAAFSGTAYFQGAAFSGTADFQGAAFSGTAYFQGAAFSGYAIFERAAFSDTAEFQGAAFSGTADFQRAAFSGTAYFQGAAFSGTADFLRAAFSGPAVFQRATFSGPAVFQRAAFSGLAYFELATYQHCARFHDAKFMGSTSFERARFVGPGAHPFEFYETRLHESANFDHVAWPEIPSDPDAHLWKLWRRGVREKLRKRRKKLRDTIRSHRRAYERLKLLMDGQKKLQDEHLFFAKEMRCREATEGVWMSWLLYRPFRLLSGYGWSIARPCAAIGISTVIGWLLLTGPYRVAPADALAFSLSNQVGFLGFHRYLLPETLEQVRSAGGAWLIGAQTVAGVLFLFLLITALRNRFRLK